MEVTRFELIGPFRLRIHFVDGVTLEVQFVADRAAGAARTVLTADAFAAARLQWGTVCWASGYCLDAALARVRADEAPVWLPTE